MAQTKVPGTKIRGGTYHLNIAIPPGIRHLHQGRALLTGTLGTSDAKVAANGVTVARARLIEQAQGLDLTARLAALSPDQRALYYRTGGLDELEKEFKRTQDAQAFLLIGEQSIPTAQAAEIGLNPLEAEVIAAERRAASATLANIARREAKTLRGFGKKVEVPGGDLSGVVELAEAYIRAKSYTVQNADSMRYTARRWIEFHGDLPLNKLTRVHLAEFDDAARDLPVARQFLKMPMRAAVAAARKSDLDRVSYKVRERLVTHMKALLAFAVDKGLVPSDPWVGYKFDRPKVKVAERRARKVESFTPDEVKTILDHVAATTHAETIDYWLPLLSAYCGARREELGQLRVSDVLTAGNIPALRITDEGEEQKVKNAHSLRTIPVPPVCIDRGFLDFAERRRQAGGKMLFLEEHRDKRRGVTLREMTPNSRGRLTEGYGGRFERKVLTPLGLKVRGQGFHAFRHSWTDAARRAKTDPEIRRLIAGRLDGEDATEARYGGGDLLADKLEALIKIAPFVESGD